MVKIAHPFEKNIANFDWLTNIALLSNYKLIEVANHLSFKTNSCLIFKYFHALVFFLKPQRSGWSFCLLAEIKRSLKCRQTSHSRQDSYKELFKSILFYLSVLLKLRLNFEMDRYWNSMTQVILAGLFNPRKEKREREKRDLELWREYLNKQNHSDQVIFS